MQPNVTQTAPNSGLVPFDAWLQELGKTRVTGWRWRKEGVVATENIFGKLYISREEISRFETRVRAGEFRKTPIVPVPPEPELA